MLENNKETRFVGVMFPGTRISLPFPLIWTLKIRSYSLFCHPRRCRVASVHIHRFSMSHFFEQLPKTTLLRTLAAGSLADHKQTPHNGFLIREAADRKPLGAFWLLLFFLLPAQGFERIPYCNILFVRSTECPPLNSIRFDTPMMQSLGCTKI